MPRPEPKTIGATMVCFRREMLRLKVSPQKMATILGAAPFSGFRWANGQSPLSQLYWARLHLLTVLREYDPEHWTDERIARGRIDWEHLHEDPHAPPAVTSPSRLPSKNGHKKAIKRYALPHEMSNGMVA